MVLALIAVSGVVFGAWVTYKVKKMNQPVDNATVLKTHVEAEKIRAEVDRARIDNDGREVEIARGLLDDIRKELDRYRDEMERLRAEMERVRTDSQEQVSRVIESSEIQHAEVVTQMEAFRAQQTVLRLSLHSHIPWDRTAHELLLRTDPDFPPPPPVSFHWPASSEIGHPDVTPGGDKEPPADGAG